MGHHAFACFLEEPGARNNLFDGGAKVKPVLIREDFKDVHTGVDREEGRGLLVLNDKSR